jgi:hypothetical protein
MSSSNQEVARIGAANAGMIKFESNLISSFNLLKIGEKQL